MTWSRKPPRGNPHLESTSSPAPLSWAPDELALDTSGLHERFLLPVDEASHGVGGAEPQDMEQALHDAFARGFEEGRQSGARVEASRLRDAFASIAEVLDALQMDSDKWVGNAEGNICALAVAVARHIIGKEIATDNSSLTDVVRQAVTAFPLDQPLTVRINPADLQAINSAFAALGDASPLTDRKDVHWLSDDRIAAGGCLIEGRDRIVDGRVDTALERVYRRLSYTGA